MKNILLSIIVLLSATAVGYGDYSIRWHTIDGGGGKSSGGQYIVTGTIGQHDAAYSYSDDYELLGGFWSGSPLCRVNFVDFSRFAQWWLMPCNPGNNQCEGANLDGLGDVDQDDLILFSELWLESCPQGWLLK